MPSLLAVDLGLRTGLALYGADGRLQWYRSQNFGSMARLKRGAYGVLSGVEGLTHVVLEGGGRIAEVWTRAAGKQDLRADVVDADVWRRALFHPRQQRTGADAKQHADTFARAVIDWSGAARPTSLRHDAAEAICVGLWAVLQLGWLETPPPGLGR